ncbi:hypothetical protein D9M68_702770 [compost metagenome]
MRRSRCTYSCSQSSPEVAARTSSSRDVDAVDSTNGNPALCAARARWMSASGQNRPFRPVGPTTAGMAAVAPSTGTSSRHSDTSTSTSGRNSRSAYADALRAIAMPFSAPPSR